MIFITKGRTILKKGETHKYDCASVIKVHVKVSVKLRPNIKLLAIKKTQCLFVTDFTDIVMIADCVRYVGSGNWSLDVNPERYQNMHMMIYQNGVCVVSAVGKISDC